VTLAAMGSPLRADQRRELRASGVERAYAAEYALEWMDDPWSDVDRAGEWLRRIAGEVEPDVVHVNGYAHAALPWSVPVVVVGHSDVLSWHEAVRGAPAGPEWGRYRAAVQAGLERTDLLVAPTRALLDDLVRLYAPTCPRVAIANACGRRFETRAKRRLVIAAGRVWDDAKNVHALVRVAPRLPWPVAVAGEGAVGAGVHALGRLTREQLDAALAGAAIFAEPARYEPFGLAALEAGLARCALVLGDIPSLREVWADAALFVDPDDDAALEAALRSLIDDAGLLAEYAGRARERALTFTPERMAEGYLAAYELVLGRDRVEAA
jgi:glycogen(starch) synthase